MSFFGAKKALLEHFIFFLEGLWGFLWCWVRQQTKQSMEMRSYWYSNNLFSLISKGNPAEEKQKGAELLPFVISTPQMNKNMQKRSNRKKTNETMVILFAVSIKKKQH